MRWVATGIVAILAASPLQADEATGLPFVKRARATYRIETPGLYHDYVFVLCREGLRYDATKKEFDWFREASFIDLTPDQPLVLHFAWGAIEEPVDKQRKHEEGYLLIVPRRIASSYSSAMDLAQAESVLSDPAVVTSRSFGPLEMVPSWAADEITITYRVERKPSGEGLELVRTSRPPLWEWNAVAMGIAAVVVSTGWWIVRRIRRSYWSSPIPHGSPPAAR